MENKVKNPQLQVEMDRYRPNKMSFWFCMLAIIIMCLVFCFNYEAISKSTVMTTVDIITNIILLLFIFLASEKLKAYDINWSYVTIGMAVLNLIRIFIYPLSLFNEKQINLTLFIFNIVGYASIAVLLGYAGFVSLKKGIALKNYLKSLDEGGN